MRNKEDHGYRNPAYIYDEGPTGGGPDSRSASSTSSRSSMKYLSTKLKSQGPRRWLLLALIVFVAIVVIVAVTTAIYFTRNKTNSSNLAQAVVDDDQGQTTEATYLPPVTISTSKATIRTETTAKSTSMATNRTTTTTRLVTSKVTMTPKPTLSTKQTTAATTKNTPTTAKSTQLPSSTSSTMLTPTTTELITSTKTTTTEPVTSGPNNTDTITATVTSSHNATEIVTTMEPASNVSGNLSVSMSKILYNPTDVKSLTLQCVGHHSGNWQTLTIRRQFKDSYEPVAVAVFNENNEIEVFKFYPNVSHMVNFGDAFVSFTLSFDPFLCSELTNFTCALANEEETASTRANITVFMPDPEIELPHSIVEEKKVTVQCSAEVWGNNAAIVWKFKPEYAQSFMEFSVKPENNVTQGDCTTVIKSTLEFNPTMYENGAQFRCEVKDFDYHPQVMQQTTSDITLKVVPSNYCEGKRQFTIHPHPHGPCTLVIYCLDTGPLVYEIECEKGHCYDYTKTACVLPENG